MVRVYGLILLLLLPVPASTQDEIELQTTIIKGNKELPKILFIVPWKEVQPTQQNQQELILHSLNDDLFDPVVPLRY